MRSLLSLLLALVALPCAGQHSIAPRVYETSPRKAEGLPSTGPAIAVPVRDGGEKSITPREKDSSYDFSTEFLNSVDATGRAEARRLPAEKAKELDLTVQRLVRGDGDTVALTKKIKGFCTTCSVIPRTSGSVAPQGPGGGGPKPVPSCPPGTRRVDDTCVPF